MANKKDKAEIERLKKELVLANQIYEMQFNPFLAPEFGLKPTIQK